MTNALIEVHFSMRHYRINKDSESFDFFVAYIEQIVILTSGQPSARDAYKRKNLRDGPYHPASSPSVTTGSRTAPSTSSAVETGQKRAREGEQEPKATEGREKGKKKAKESET
jgi:hypothetical protein